MCRVCWLTTYNSSKNLPKLWEEIVLDIEKLYVKAPTGGPLHMVLDDWNLDDRFLEIPESERFFWEREVYGRSCEIATQLKTLSLDQRAAVLAKWEKYF